MPCSIAVISAGSSGRRQSMPDTSPAKTGVSGRIDRLILALSFGSKQAAVGEVAHQRQRAELPGRDPVAAPDSVDEGAKLWRRNRDDVAEFVGKAFAGRVAVVDRR